MSDKKIQRSESQPTTRKLKVIDDGGHAWLDVANEDVKSLGIAEKITPYSYMSPKRSYLEEDLDAGVFLEAAKKAGWKVGTATRHVDRSAPLRGYASFKPEWIENPLREGSQGRLHGGQKATIQSNINGKVIIRDEHGGMYGCPSTRILSCFFTEERYQQMKMDEMERLMRESKGEQDAPPTRRLKLNRTHDLGSSFLSVDNLLLKELGIEAAISTFSGMTPSRSYLRGPLDDKVFLEAAIAAGWEVAVQEQHIDGLHPARKQSSFQPDWIRTPFAPGVEGHLLDGRKCQIERMDARQVVFLAEDGERVTHSVTTAVAAMRSEQRHQQVLSEKVLEKGPPLAR